MTYRELLGRLDLDYGGAAQLLGVSWRTSARYASASGAPPVVLTLLRLMVRLKLSPEDVR